MKREILCIRCNKETKTRFRIDYILSEARDQDEFVNKLLDIYEILCEKYGVKKIDSILDYLRGYAIVVRGR